MVSCVLLSLSSLRRSSDTRGNEVLLLEGFFIELFDFLEGIVAIGRSGDEGFPGFVNESVFGLELVFLVGEESAFF